MPGSHAPLHDPDLPVEERRLLTALSAARRRYLAAALPSLQEARHQDPRTRMGAALEAARAAIDVGAAPPEEAHAAFVASLDTLIRAALDPQRGDTVLQAALWRRRHPAIDEHRVLLSTAHADRRRIKALVDAIAHPVRRAAEPLSPGLPALYEHAAAQDWAALASALERALGEADDEALQSALASLREEAALQRLSRAAWLAESHAVREHRRLLAAASPPAGSAEATERGRLAARTGRAAEHAMVDAFQAIAEGLNRQCDGARRYRALHSLRVPSGVPGALPGAKDEWDAVMLREVDGGRFDLVMLAEVKAAPTAALSDVPRLSKGLQRLAGLDLDPVPLATSGQTLAVTRRSLRRLQPPGRALPLQVFYGCTAPMAAAPAPLSTLAEALLLSDPASLTHAAALQQGELPDPAWLDQAWHRVIGARPSPAVLRQHETDAMARAAMLHPEDLLAAVRDAGIA